MRAFVIFSVLLSLAGAPSQADLLTPYFSCDQGGLVVGRGSNHFVAQIRNPHVIHDVQELLSQLPVGSSGRILRTGWWMEAGAFRVESDSVGTVLEFRATDAKELNPLNLPGFSMWTQASAIEANPFEASALFADTVMGRKGMRLRVSASEWIPGGQVVYHRIGDFFFDRCTTFGH